MPSASAAGTVAFKITSDGTPLPDATRLLAIRVRAELNRIPEATIVLGDGDIATNTFPLADGALLKPGAEVAISLGYGDSVEEVFKGVVTGQRMRVLGTDEPRLQIRCHSKAFKLAIGRKSAVFRDMKDSDVASQLIAAVGLAATTATTSLAHPELVQHDCTDWDFLVRRAEVNGLVLRADGDEVALEVPELAAAAQATATLGVDIRRLDVEVEARGQLASVEAIGWDGATLDTAAATKTGEVAMDWGDLDATTLSAIGGLDVFTIRTTAPVSSTMLGTIAEARCLRAAMSRMRGTVLVDGASGIKPGMVLDIEGAGSRFGGSAFVTGIVHRVEDGDWSTEAILGQGPEAASVRDDVDAPGAAAFLPAVRGLQVGMVQQVHDDPDGAGRIMVKLPLIGPDASIWARVASPYASNAAGMRFLPEIGDEVVLAFMNDDPTAPIVLGSLFGKTNVPPFTSEDGNNRKVLRTRSGLEVAFDDDKKTMTLRTPGGNTVVLDDDDKSILLEDQHGSKVKLGTNGISLESPKDISLDAKGKVSIAALANVEIAARRDLTLDGVNVKATAQVAFSGSGNAQAELKASGQVSVKGALVMIN